MYVKVENSGCCEHDQMVQLRFCMYLEPKDYGFDKTQIEVFTSEPIIDVIGDRILPSLAPKIQQTCPFHNHFICVEPTLSEIEILDLGETLLKDAYAAWKGDKKIELRNPHIADIEKSEFRLNACNTKLQKIKALSLERRISWL